MQPSDIIGTWYSYQMGNVYGSQPYDKETITFNANGTGVIKTKSLLFRTIKFLWDGPNNTGDFLVRARTGEHLYYISALPGGEIMGMSDGAMYTKFRR